MMCQNIGIDSDFNLTRHSHVSGNLMIVNTSTAHGSPLTRG